MPPFALQWTALLAMQKPGTFQRKIRARSNADLHSRSQSLGVTEQSAPSELVIYRQAQFSFSSPASAPHTPAQTLRSCTACCD